MTVSLPENITYHTETEGFRKEIQGVLQLVGLICSIVSSSLKDKWVGLRSKENRTSMSSSTIYLYLNVQFDSTFFSGNGKQPYLSCEDSCTRWSLSAVWLSRSTRTRSWWMNLRALGSIELGRFSTTASLARYQTKKVNEELMLRL
jgi:hypothetical protein